LSPWLKAWLQAIQQLRQFFILNLLLSITMHLLIPQERCQVSLFCFSFPLPSFPLPLCEWMYCPKFLQYMCIIIRLILFY
jgi:hypothetical protein